MAFYKLYCIVHRRTDYVGLYRIARQLAYPEWYKDQERIESERDKRKSIMQIFGAMQAISKQSPNGYSYMNLL